MRSAARRRLRAATGFGKCSSEGHGARFPTVGVNETHAASPGLLEIKSISFFVTCGTPQKESQPVKVSEAVVGTYLLHTFKILCISQALPRKPVLLDFESSQSNSGNDERSGSNGGSHGDSSGDRPPACRGYLVEPWSTYIYIYMEPNLALRPYHSTRQR